MIADPKRLFDADDPELSAAIGAARRRVPTRDRMNAIASRLAAAGVAVPPEFRPELSASEVPAALTTSGAVSKGLVAALAVAGVALVGVLAVIGFRAEPNAPSTASPVAGPTAPVVDSAAPALVPPPHAGDAVTKPALPSVELADPPEAAPRAEVTSNSAPVAPPVAARKPADTLAQSEIELLKRARSALSSDPSVSLQLVERARQHFPQSSFGQEREFIAISALYKLGRRSEAATRERAFRDRHPRSAYLPQLDRLSSGP